MRRMFFLLAMLIAFVTPLSAQTTVVVGDTTSTSSSSVVPVDYFFTDGMSQMLYLSSEVESGLITSLSFWHEGDNVNEGVIHLYMKEVSDANLSNGWLSGTDWVEVYTGSLPLTPGWVTMEFDNPFVYTGVQNLAVGFIRDGDQYYSGHSWKTTTTSFISCVYFNQDYFDFDMTEPPYYHDLSGNRPVVKFGIAELEGYCFPPSGMEISAIDETEVTISWSAHETSTAFGLSYKELSSDTWIDVPTPINDTTYTISGLSSFTQYVAKVWTICSAENSSERQISFTTVPSASDYLQLPYEQNFDDLEAISGWVTETFGVNAWHIGAATNNTLDENGELTIGNALYVSNDNGATNSYMIEGSNAFSYYYALLNIEEDNYYGLEFDYKCVGESGYDELRVYLLPYTMELEDYELNYQYEIGTVNQSPSWTRHSFLLPETTAPGVYKLVFAWLNDTGTGNNPPAAVDNIKLYSTNCQRVQAISATMEDMDESVTMTLTIEDESEDGTVYLVEYKAENEAVWQSIQSESPVLIENLPYATKLEYRVTAICPDGAQSVASETFVVYTICSSFTELPYEENFENPFLPADEIIGNAAAPMCWFNINGAYSDHYFYRDTYSDLTIGSASLAYEGIYSSTSTTQFSDWLISPKIELTGEQRLNFKFKNISSSTTYVLPRIDVFVYDANETDITSAADTAQFVYLSTAYDPTINSENWSVAEVNLSQYTGTVRLALAVRQPSRSFLIDEFIISEIPSCPELYGFSVAAASDASVAVSYNTANLVETGVTVAYAEAEPGDTVMNFEGATTITIPYDAELPYVIEGLTPGATYMFTATQACGTNYVDPINLTLPVVYTVPFYADFDTPETTPTVEFTTSSIDNAWHIGTLQNNTQDEDGNLTENGGAMYISPDNGISFGYNTSSYTEAYATIPLLIPEGDALEYVFSFDYIAGGEGDSWTTYDYISVYLVPSGAQLMPEYALLEGDHNTFIWKHVEVGKGNLSGLYNLVFKWRNNGISGSQPSVAIDNIKVEGRSCSGTIVDVSLAFVEGDESNSLIVNLEDAGNTGVTYNLSCTSPDDEEPLEVTGLTLEDFPYTILQNAEFSTLYSVSASVICSDESEIEIGEYEIKTPCAATAIPWFENFSTEPLSNECWIGASALLPTNGEVSLQNMEIPYYSWNQNTAMLGTQTALVESINIYGADVHAWLITPTLDLGNDGVAKQVAFDVAMTSYYGNSAPESAPDDRFIVFVSTDGGATWDIDNALVFADNDSDTEHNFSNFTNSFQRYVFKLVDENDEPLTGKVRIAFYGESTQTNGDNYLYLDNVAVEDWTTCQKPYEIEISEITQNSAEVSFLSYGSTAWEYVVVAGENADLTTSTPIAAQASSSIGLTELASSTTYTFAVRSVCDSETSEWVTATFTTLAQPTAIPYTSSFDNIGNWFVTNTSTIETTNAWAIGTATASEDGGSSAYISNDGGQSYAATIESDPVVTHLWQDFDFGTTSDNFELSFDWKAIGQQMGSYVNGGIIVYLTDLSAMPETGFMPNSDELITVLGADEWQSERIYLGNVTGVKRLVFTAYGYTSAEEIVTPAAIDNVSLSVVSCEPIQAESVEISAIETTSAVVTWTDADETHNSWSVYYKSPADEDYLLEVVTDTTVTLTNLTPSSPYTVMIAVNCPDGESVPTAPVTFITACEVVTEFPYFESFETDEFICWTQVPTLGGYEWEITTAYYSQNLPATDGMNMAYYGTGNGASNELSSPIFDLSSMSEPYLKFDYLFVEWAGDIDELKVKYRTNSSETFTTLKTYTTASNQWRTDSIALPNPSSTYQIMFEGILHYGYGVALDAISVYDADEEGGGVVPPTPDPCDAPTALAANNITETTADITWTGTSTSYEVRLDGGVAEAVSGTTKQYTGLTPNTAYTVEVRAVCEGQTSDWVSVQFTTLEEEVVVVTPPTVATLAASEITHESAVLNGTITAGSEEITAQGFMYKATAAADWTTVAATGTTITATLTALTAETEYTFKAFATTASGTVEGEAMSFTTTAAPVVIVAPEVVTLAASEITNASATLNATVTAGSEEITAQGFMYKATAAAEWTTVAATGENMTATVEGLEAEMAYEYKAFATTESGTVEGEVMSFTTLAGLNDAETINAMIYPNPADDKAIISVSVAGAKIVVSDMQGRILLSDDMNESTYELNTANMAAGVYYIRIISGNTVNTQKLIVK